MAIPASWIDALRSDAGLVRGLLESAATAHRQALDELLRGMMPEMEASEIVRLREQRRAEFERTIAERHPDVAASLAATRADAGRFVTRFGPAPPLLDLEKSWDVLNYVLTGGRWDAGESAGAAAFLVTGEAIGEDVGYGPARLHMPDAVLAIADALSELDGDRLAARLDFEKLAQVKLYTVPDDVIVDAAEREAWIEDTRSRGAALLACVADAARDGRALLVWMS